MKKIAFLVLFGILLGSVNIQAQDKSQTTVKIETNYGNITLVLYNETPQHRDNFIKLIKEGWYNNSPFHRVIDNFMIQGGGNADGTQDPGYTVPAEFNTELFHKKGALAAARMGDGVNPEKASSGCQFYIVEGTKQTRKTLEALGMRSGKTWTEEQIKVYETIGGTPFLDDNYTVFGEVTEGLDVVEKIAAVGAKEKITMTITIVK